jgi:crossover junction endodeoxyribonuclease RuvC
MTARAFDVEVVGIDPGTTGAMAALSADAELLAIADMPNLTTHTPRAVVDAVALSDWLRQHRPARGVWVEQVSAMPTDSRVSAFAFGRAVGVTEAVCLLLAMSLNRVQPVAWKRAAGLPAGAPKAASVEAARRLVPSSAPHLTRVRDHNRADAVLIALHGLRQSGR